MALSIYEQFECLRKAYINSKRLLEEIENGIIFRSDDYYNAHYRIVTHIDYVVSTLPEDERFFIQNSLKYGDSSKWFIGYMSPTKYYVSRKKSYDSFLHCLEQ